MAYVALSRVRSAADVELLDYNESKITANERVVDFYQKVCKLFHNLFITQIVKLLDKKPLQESQTYNTA